MATLLSDTGSTTLPRGSRRTFCGALIACSTRSVVVPATSLSCHLVRMQLISSLATSLRPLSSGGAYPPSPVRAAGLALANFAVSIATGASPVERRSAFLALLASGGATSKPCTPIVSGKENHSVSFASLGRQVASRSNCSPGASTTCKWRTRTPAPGKSGPNTPPSRMRTIAFGFPCSTSVTEAAGFARGLLSFFTVTTTGSV